MSETQPLRRAVFLDRDGTIGEELGYVNHIDRFQMFPYAAEAIRQLNRADIPVIVVTNQSGIARNIFPESLVHEVHKKMIAQLAAGGAWIDAIYFCPHKSEDACECRKPNPGLLEQDQVLCVESCGRPRPLCPAPRSRLAVRLGEATLSPRCNARCAVGEARK